MRKPKFTISPLTYIPGGVKITLHFSDGTTSKTQHSNVKYPYSYVTKVMNELPKDVTIDRAYAGKVLFFSDGKFMASVPTTKVKGPGSAKVF